MFYRYKRRTEVLVRTTTNVNRIRQNMTTIKLIMTKLTKTKLKFKRGTFPVRTIIRVVKMCWIALVILMMCECLMIKMYRYLYLYLLFLNAKLESIMMIKKISKGLLVSIWIFKSFDEMFVLKVLIYILVIRQHFRSFVAQKEIIKKGAKNIDTATDEFKATIDYDKNDYDKILNKIMEE